MAFCQKCGKQVADDAKFCDGCGAQIGGSSTNNTKVENSRSTFETYVKTINDTNDYTYQMSNEDIQNNKIMAVICYISWLVLIPFFAAKQSSFAQFHAKQGMTLFLLEVVFGIASFIIGVIFGAIWTPLGVIWHILATIVWIAICAVAIIGIINAVQGKAKELPFIGSMKIFK